MSRSILVVEDDGDVRAVLVDLLTDEGYMVFEASHGREVLQVLADLKRHPSLITLDL